MESNSVCNHVRSSTFHSGHLSFFFKPNCHNISKFTSFVNVVPEMLIDETAVLIDLIDLFNNIMLQLKIYLLVFNC